MAEAKKAASTQSAPKKKPTMSPKAKPAAAKAAGAKQQATKAGKHTKSSHPAHAHPEDNYTDPALRDRIKAEVMAGDKGGRPGQWSARKAQLVAHEYQAQGGGYKHERTEAQESLKEWGDEHWHTADGKPAIQGDETHRYLPDQAWNELTPEQKKATDAKKVAGSDKGKQYVANTTAASKARKHATDHND